MPGGGALAPIVRQPDPFFAVFVRCCVQLVHCLFRFVLAASTAMHSIVAAVKRNDLQTLTVLLDQGAGPNAK